MRRTGKRNAELEQIPNLGSDAPTPPFQSCYNLHPCCRDRRMQSLSPDGCLTLVHSPLTQPRPGQPVGEKQPPHKGTAHSRDAAAGICPIGTARLRAQPRALQKVVAAHTVPSSPSPQPWYPFQQRLLGVNESKGPLNRMASRQAALQPPAVLLKEI